VKKQRRIVSVVLCISAFMVLGGGGLGFSVEELEISPEYLKSSKPGASLDNTSVESTHPSSFSSSLSRDSSPAGIVDTQIAYLTRKIEKSPQDATLFNERGMLYRQKGDYDHAISDLTRALDLLPAMSRAYYNRAWVYLDLGQSDKALMDVEKALEGEPALGDAFFLRGTIYQQKM
jgi:tetratricopeptide (TPR) repeat protein